MTLWIILFIILAAVMVILPYIGRVPSSPTPDAGGPDIIRHRQDHARQERREELDLDLVMGKIRPEDHRELIAELAGEAGEITEG